MSVASRIAGVYVDPEALPRADRTGPEQTGITGLRDWVTPMPGGRGPTGTTGTSHVTSAGHIKDGRRIDLIIRGMERADAATLLGTHKTLASVSTLLALNKTPPPATRGVPRAQHYVTAEDLRKLPCQVDVAVDLTFSHFAAHIHALPFFDRSLPAGPSQALSDLIFGISWEPGLHSVDARRSTTRT